MIDVVVLSQTYEHVEHCDGQGEILMMMIIMMVFLYPPKIGWCTNWTGYERHLFQKQLAQPPRP